MRRLFATGSIALVLLLSACAAGQSATDGSDGFTKEATRELKGS